MTEHLTDVVTEGGDGVQNDRPAAEVAEGEEALATGWSRTTRRLVEIVALVPVVLVAGALAGCTPASGGTASVTGSRLQFDAVTGRNNSITVSLGAVGDWGPVSLLLTDSRNPVTPGSGCTRVNDDTVQCSTDSTGAAAFYDQLIHLGDGNDTFASSVTVYGDTVVDAGAGDDVVDGGPWNTVVRAGEGNDTVNGGPEKNDIDAGRGDDTVNGGPKRNVVDAGNGNDIVNGGPSADVVHAGTGNDTVNGGSGDDVLYEDSDAFDIDSFSGGAGHDSIHYVGVLHGVNISLNDAADDGRPGEGDNVKSDIEDIRGSGNADTLIGDGDANWIFGLDLDELDRVPQDPGGLVIDGGGGNDYIWGSASESKGDRLWGGTGNDGIVGWAGNDALSGGPGDDGLSGGAGFDALDGGSETDSCDVGSSDSPIDLLGGTAVNCETGP